MAVTSHERPYQNHSDSVTITISVTDAAAVREFLHCLGNRSGEISFSEGCIAESGAHPCLVTINPSPKRNSKSRNWQ